VSGQLHILAALPWGVSIW